MVEEGNVQDDENQGSGCWSVGFQILGFLIIVFLIFQCTRIAFFTDSPEERIQEAIERAAGAETEVEMATAEADLATARAEATQIVVEATADAEAEATAEAIRSREATAEARAEIRQRAAEGQEKLDKAIEDGDIDEIEDLLDDGVHPPAFKRCLENYNNSSARANLLTTFNYDLIDELPVSWRTRVKMNSAIIYYLDDDITWAEASHQICKAMLIEAVG